eukprot:scaffold4707_cov96-Skeletonema_dohrnii-CCMP3373.AAC.2
MMKRSGGRKKKKTHDRRGSSFCAIAIFRADHPATLRPVTHPKLSRIRRKHKKGSTANEPVSFPSEKLPSNLFTSRQTLQLPSVLFTSRQFSSLPVKLFTSRQSLQSP